VEVFNLFGDAWDYERDQPGFGCKAIAVGRRLGAELLGGSLYEIPAGEKMFPYHLHHAKEEWLLVLAGTPTLRDPQGERALAPGDVVAFRTGPDGAHQVINRSPAPVRVLMLSTAIVPEIVEYPDSDKVGAATRDARWLLRRQPQVDYWEGEE
jgi:uncharacterized cupin superfamily protein